MFKLLILVVGDYKKVNNFSGTKYVHCLPFGKVYELWYNCTILTDVSVDVAVQYILYIHCTILTDVSVDVAVYTVLYFLLCNIRCIALSRWY